MKINKKNYLLYLVIFAAILLLFYYLLSDKDAIIRQLQNEFYNTKEGLDTNEGLDWVVYDGTATSPLAKPETGKVRYSGKGAYDLSTLSKITSNIMTANAGRDHYFTIILTGYFKPNESGNWIFRTNSDDASFLWLGQSADSGWSSSNAIVNNGNDHGMRRITSKQVYLDSRFYYPIRIQMSETGGLYDLTVDWAPPSNNSSFSSNGSGKLYSTKYFSSTASPEKGLIWKAYKNYFNDQVNFGSSYELMSSGIAVDTSGLNAITEGKILENVCIKGMDPDNLSVENCNTNINDSWCDNKGKVIHVFSMELYGFFFTYTTNTDPSQEWSFYTYSDDSSFMWIGDKALNGWNTGNADINNGGLHGMRASKVKVAVKTLKPNTYYPIRLQFGENCGGYNFRFAWKPPGGNWTTNGNGYLYRADLSKSDADFSYYGVMVGTEI